MNYYGNSLVLGTRDTFVKRVKLGIDDISLITDGSKLVLLGCDWKRTEETIKQELYQVSSLEPGAGTFVFEDINPDYPFYRSGHVDGYDYDFSEYGTMTFICLTEFTLFRRQYENIPSTIRYLYIGSISQDYKKDLLLFFIAFLIDTYRVYPPIIVKDIIITKEDSTNWRVSYGTDTYKVSTEANTKSIYFSN